MHTHSRLVVCNAYLAHHTLAGVLPWGVGLSGKGVRAPRSSIPGGLPCEGVVATLLLGQRRRRKGQVSSPTRPGAGLLLPRRPCEGCCARPARD